METTAALNKGAHSLNLSGAWKFQMSPWETADRLDQTVTLPGSMDENGKGVDNTQTITLHHLNRDRIYTGAAVYQREIEIPVEWAGTHIILYLERTKKTRVWIDGFSAGPGQKSYTTPQMYDITAFCMAGRRHTLTIEVDNSSAGMPHAMYTTFVEGDAWSHQLTENGQTNWNGILGKMELRSTPPISVTGLQIRPDVDKSGAAVSLTARRMSVGRPLSGHIFLSAASRNHKGRTHTAPSQIVPLAFGAEEREITVNCFYDMGNGVLLWDEFSPALYELTAELHLEERLCAVETRRFGMRSFTTGANRGGMQFFINGRPTQLRGEINCAIFPKTGYPPMDLDAWIAVFQTYRDYGLNHVRFHTWMPPQAAFHAADLLGLYLYVELPHWGRKMFGEVYRGDHSDVDYYKEDTRRIFAEYRNFPSFVMFALGNEERIGFYYYEEFLKFCKGLEPDLLCSDIAGHSTYPPSADFAAKFLIPEYLPRVEDGNDWDYAETVAAAPIPITGHEVGQLQVFPYYEQELPKYTSAVLKPRNLVEFRRRFAKAGLSELEGRFSRATGGLAAMLYRAFTESYLRTDGAGGFTLLGLQDFPGQGTALVGLLDAFLDSKGAIEPRVFRQSCSALTVLAKMKRFVWTGGEQFSAQVVIANYAARDVVTGISWSLETDSGQVMEQGALSVQTALQGGVTRYGEISCVLDKSAQARQLTLRLALTEDYDAPSAPGTNDYALWVFPPVAVSSAPPGLLIRRSYDAAAQEALGRGEKVLILSQGTAQAMPLSRAISFRPDFWSPMFHEDTPEGYSLGLYIDQDHPLFRRFPTQDFANWQWFELLRNARGFLIDEAPQALAPIVQPISTIDLPERLAAIFEARVGDGKLLVCSFDLPGNAAPASHQLLTALCAYMDSGDFTPKVALEPALLKKLLPTEHKSSFRLEIKEELAQGETAHVALVQIDRQSGQETPADSAKVSYTTSGAGVLAVDGDETVRGVGVGCARLTACVEAEGQVTTLQKVLVVGQTRLTPISLDSAQITATSTHARFPISHMTDGDRDTFWLSDNVDKTACMPQEVLIELPVEAEVSALLCGARRDHSRGAILEATVSLSMDGADFTIVCVRRWEEDTIIQNRFFAFPPQTARFIKLIVERTVLHTGDTNAAAISELLLYSGTTIGAIESLPVHEVRFGTTLEKALKSSPLPRAVQVTLSDGTQTEAPVTWLESDYRPDLARDYQLRAIPFLEGVANPGELRAVQIIRVLPRDMTAPPDKRRLDALIARTMELSPDDYGGDSWAALERLREQAVRFNALTGAVQHDVDTWEEQLRDAVDDLVAQ